MERWVHRVLPLAGVAVTAALVLASVAAGPGRAGAVEGGARDASHTAAAEATSTPVLTTVVLGDVTVRRGRAATIRYRCDHAAGGAVVAELLVTDRPGKVVRTLVHGKTVPGGLAQTWTGKVTLPAGRYVVTAHARDATGLSESRATPASLVVLKPLPAAVPAEGSRRAAFAWAARRAGRVAVAVVDSRGRLYGHHAHEGFLSASVVKAMLLVAYLRGHDTVSPAMKDVLTRMIERSDNEAADAVYAVVGRGGLERLAHLAGMKGFRTTGAWITTRITAADMAQFFRDMHRWLPSRHRGLADRLLSHVTPYQCWGIPAVARPLGYRVYFKPGWLGAWVLASQAARLERGRVRIGLAVLTDDNPTGSYGKETVAGVTARLLRE